MIGNTIHIIGGGESGVGAALLARKHGFDILVSDFGGLKPQFRKELDTNGIAYEEGGHELVYESLPDIVVKSPGVPPLSEVIQYYVSKGIEIISEIEFGVRYAGNSRFIAITGTNGKTTTTLLIYHILKSAGRSVGLTGNIGTSLARQIAVEPKEIYVVELSSFQLDDLYSLKADTAILTNITPDHLDRYEYKLENYINSKFRILQNMVESDFFIHSLDDPISSKEVSNRSIIAKKVGVTKELLHEGSIELDDITIDLSGSPLKGEHNLMNSIMAIYACLNEGLNSKEVVDGLNSFKNAPHRLEVVADINGIHYVNDSKATNVDSTFYALGAFDFPIAWIAGGVDKGNDYDQIKDIVREKVSSLICLGVDNEKLLSAFGNIVPKVFETQDIRDAAKLAYENSSNHDTVLLSPACASFDLFKNYEDRGDKFREAVLELKKEIENQITQ